MKFLNDLLARLADVPADEQAQVVQQTIAEANNINPSELSQAVLDMFDSLTGGEEPASEETLNRLESLAKVADGVQSIQAVAEERQQRADEIGDRLRNLVSSNEGNEGEDLSDDAREAAAENEGEDGSENGESEPQEPAAENNDNEPAPAEGDDAPAESREMVAANVTPDKRVPLGNRNIKNSPPPAPKSNMPAGLESFSLVAAADVPGYSTGQTMGNGLDDLASAWEQRMMPLITSNVNSGVDGQRSRVGIARITRSMPDAYTINDDNEAEDKIAFATNEFNLPGGNLVAAAGWCAPSEVLYDLCPIRMTNTGMINLPTVVARRGGIRYPADFDWSSVWGDIGFYLTEAEVIAGTEKPCIEVPCPTDWQECRLDVAGLCIRTPILMERGWPERVRQFMEGAMLIHAHKMNARMLARMEELSTRIVIPSPEYPNPVGTIVDPHGPGMTESVLSVLELQVQFQRYNERLAQNASLELVAPYWLRGVLKSDLRKKLGIDNRWAITDQVLDTYLRAIGVNPQWVYGWQECFSHPQDPNGFGCNPPVEWPNRVKFLLYPAGTFFRLAADVINLDGVYDHASLVQNVYTALFTEEGWQVCNRCMKSYVIEMDICPNGLSGAFQSTACGPEPEPEPEAPALAG